MLQGRNRCWYAGAYTLINTHEIAVMSGLAAADRLVRLRTRVESARLLQQLPRSGGAVLDCRARLFAGAKSDA